VGTDADVGFRWLVFARSHATPNSARYASRASSRGSCCSPR
jgi:hypothetical protein